MQVSIETMTGLERRMTIVVPSETFEQQIVDRLKQTARRVRLAGFRPGHVPMKEVHRRFGRSVRQDVASDVMQSSFFEALRQEDLAPAGSPSLEVLKMDPGVDFEFAATFEVVPEVGLVGFDQIEVERPVVEVLETDVDRMTETLRSQRRTFEPVARGAALEDRVMVDFVGRIDGETFEGSTATGVQFVVGAGQMIDAFDEGVRGVVPGASTEFDATFPDDYRAEALRGKTARFEVTVTEVAAPKLPELGAEFFSSFGLAEGGLEAFRAEVRDNMERELAAAVRQQVRRGVLDELARLHDMQLPATMVARETAGLKQQMRDQMSAYSRGGIVPEMPDDLFRAQAERRVKLSLVLNAIIRQRSLTADAARVRARIEELAKPYAEPEQVVRWYYSNEAQLDRIELAVLEEQVVDLVLETANVKEVPSTYEEVIRSSGGAPRDADHIHDHAAQRHDHHDHDHEHLHDHEHHYDHEHHHGTEHRHD